MYAAAQRSAAGHWQSAEGQCFNTTMRAGCGVHIPRPCTSSTHTPVGGCRPVHGEGLKQYVQCQRMGIARLRTSCRLPVCCVGTANIQDCTRSGESAAECTRQGRWCVVASCSVRRAVCSGGARSSQLCVCVAAADVKLTTACSRCSCCCDTEHAAASKVITVCRRTLIAWCMQLYTDQSFTQCEDILSPTHLSFAPTARPGPPLLTVDRSANKRPDFIRGGSPPWLGRRFLALLCRVRRGACPTTTTTTFL
jgi:hypothetical protein